MAAGISAAVSGTVSLEASPIGGSVGPKAPRQQVHSDGQTAAAAAEDGMPMAAGGNSGSELVQRQLLASLQQLEQVRLLLFLFLALVSILLCQLGQPRVCQMHNALQ